jgi:DNA modification methylase
MTLKIERLPIEKLAFDPANARKHSDVNLSAIAESLRKFGQRKPVVVTIDNLIVAGNGTVEAAFLIGMTDVDVVRVPADWSPDQVKAFALADNRTAELAEWNPEVLSAQLLELDEAGFDIEALGFDSVKITDKDSEAASDEYSVPDEPVTVLGDLWQIGQHLILCGDSFDVPTIERLTVIHRPTALLTDPPYGIDLETDWTAGGGKKYKPVMNDNKAFDAKALREMFDDCDEQFWWGANYYQRSLLNHDLEGSWLVWDKRNENTDSVIGAGFEMCWSRSKHKQDVLRYLWTNFTSHKNDGHKRMHPTEKPVEMLCEIIDRWIQPGSVILDLFAGSGSTLLAAHRSGCVGIGVELDPAYVDAIVERLEIATGQKAVKL